MGKELRQLWDSLPNKAVLGVLLLAWIALFHFLGNAVFGYTNTSSLWLWLNTIYENAANAGPEQGNTADDALGRYIPFMVLGFAWLKRKELIESKKSPWAPALAIVVLGLVLHTVGYIVQQTRLSVIGAIVGSYGLIGLVWGPEFLRRIFFPFCILIFAIPVASVLPTNKLRIIVATCSTALSDTLLNIKVIRKGTIIYSQNGTFHFDVAPACSGIRSLTVVTLLSTCYAFLNFKTLWRRLIIIGSAFPLAVVGNILRLCVVILVGDIWGQDKAMMIETKFGFVTFLFALGCLFGMGAVLNEERPLRFRLPSSKPDETAPKTS
jgi:exosortase